MELKVEPTKTFIFSNIEKPTVETTAEAYKRGRRVKLVSFTIWSVILIVASLVLGMGIGSKAIVSRGDAYLKAEVTRLTDQNTKLKVENYELRDCIRDRDVAVNKI